MKILLIDDDSISNFISRKIIKREVPDVELNDFTRPEEALEFLRQQPSTSGEERLIFLDINMPGMNGWDFLKALDLEFPDLPVQVIMLTSSVDPSDQSKAFHFTRVSSFISKPIQAEHLDFLKQKATNPEMVLPKKMPSFPRKARSSPSTTEPWRTRG